MRRCGYCVKFAVGKLLNPTRKANVDAIKYCTVKKEGVEFNTKHCPYFNPNLTFFCDQYHERIPLVKCLIRRFDLRHLYTFRGCQSCRQFEEDIKELVTMYHINGEKIIEPPKPIKLKIKRKTKLKRRKKQNDKTRLLRRRKKN